jgi:predicted solute-binding protein
MPPTLFRIGALKEFYCAPLTHSLEKSPAVAGLFIDAPSILIDKLMSREIDAAVVTPIDYARLSSDLKLFPAIGIASIIESNTVVLCVKRDIRELKTVAVGSATATDVVLARVILKEQFKSDVSFVPAVGDVEELLQKADAALLCGDAVLTSSWDGPTIDLIEEWTEMTGLPFVHAVCAVLADGTDRTALEALMTNALREGREDRTSTVASVASAMNIPAERIEEQFALYQYELLPTHRESIDEFFRLAYFHGVLQDVPEIKMTSHDDTDEDE